jgi:hypothetical protein
MDLPLRLLVGRHATFRSLAAEAARLREQARQHRDLAAHFLTNPHRLGHWRAHPPLPDTGFVFGHAQSAGTGGSRLLELHAAPTPAGLRLELHFAQGRLAPADATRLVELARNILCAAAEQPEAAPGDIGCETTSPIPAGGDDAFAEFMFEA